MAAVAVEYFSTRRRTAPARKGGVGGGRRSQHRGLHLVALSQSARARTNNFRTAQAPCQDLGDCRGRGRKASIGREEQKTGGAGLGQSLPPTSLLEYVPRVNLGSRTAAAAAAAYTTSPRFSAWCSRGKTSIKCPTAQARK